MNAGNGKWEWDLLAIEALDITENVVDLLIRRLERLPGETQTILKTASCIGSGFDLKTLQIITGGTATALIRDLVPAIKEDLLVTTTKKISSQSKNQTTAIMPETYKFRHDRIRQAAGTLMGAADKEALHLKIGWLVLKQMKPDQMEDAVFSIIHHLNFASQRIKKREERDKVAELNLIAGNKAKSSAAFDAAHTYFCTGIKMLDRRGWQRRYDLMLDLHVKSMDTARLCGKSNEVEKRFSIVKKNARTILDMVDAYESKIQALMAENRPSLALEKAREILKELGVDLPKKPLQSDIRAAIDETINELSGKAPGDLLKLPVMTDPYHLAAMKILGAIFSSAYLGSINLFPLIPCLQVKLSARYGNTSNSAFAYSIFGVVLCQVDGNIDMGFRFGQLGLKLLKQFNSKELEAKVYWGTSMGSHWKIHLKDSFEFSLTGYYSGVETGDFEYAAYNVFMCCVLFFLSGKPLDETQRDMARFGAIARKLKQLPSIGYFTIFHQLVLNLIGKNNAGEILGDEVYDEHTMLALHQKSGDQTAVFLFCLCKMILCYLFESYTKAIQYAEQAEKKIDFVFGTAAVPIYHFFDALIQLAVYEKQTNATKGRILKRVKACQSRMKHWAAHAPMNYRHKYHLVAAELSRVQGRKAEASGHYNLAIELAGKNGYINEEAIANELAAKFWMAQGQNEFAGNAIQRAYDCYTSWGALAKVEALLKKYPQWIVRTSSDKEATAPQIIIAEHQKGDLRHAGLDVATLAKASLAISGEIEFDRLMHTLMKIVIENAGAERGLYIMTAEEGLIRVAAQGVAEGGEISVQVYDEVAEASGQIFSGVVHYVTRTKESLVLNNMDKDGRFASDIYFQTHRPKSVMCVPIVHQSKLTGILYLENRLIADVFSSGRIEVLNLLASQIAISIENTILFERQKKAEAKYRGIFENAVEGIFLSTIEGRFVSANPALADILGYDSPKELCREITNIASQLFVLPEAFDCFSDLLKNNEAVADFEIQCRRKDGVHIWISLNARLIVYEDSEKLLIEGFIVDITERKAATDALRQREEILRKENIHLRSNIKDRYRFGRFIGKSAAMQEVYELILKAAASDASVIIYGESGTGKELVAREVHELGDRKDGNFVPVNCGAIPENLLESEFFGYKKGAFTGANADKKGYLDLSHGGTLFLDELGEISLNFQVKLLRVLEDGSYTPLGSQAVKKSDARVVAATNRDLQEAIRNRTMREDFFYRIHVIPIHLPPLRDRKEDIPLLIDHFLKIHSRNKQVPPVTGKMIEALLSHDWPGNVRELQNVLQRYWTLGQIDFIPTAKKAISEPVVDKVEQGVAESEPAYHSVMENMEKKMIISALEKHKWNRKNAALELGIPRTSFYRKLKRYEIIQK